MRFWLWRTHRLPWILVAFLDVAAERLLLRKVGGGYLFIHRLLLDYFADLETPSSEEASPASSSLQKLVNPTCKFFLKRPADPIGVEEPDLAD